MMKNWFCNDEEDRLRAGWRLTLQFVLMLLFSMVFALILYQLNGQDGQLFDSMALLAGFTLSTWSACKFLDKRKFSSLGLQINRLWIGDYLFGIAAGALIVSLLFISLLWTGWIEFTGFGWERAWSGSYLWPFLAYLITMVFVGFYEELVFRGYQITNVMEGFGSNRMAPVFSASLAVIITSAIFGILHYWNPNASGVSTLNIVFVGVILALPYLWTGNLAIPIGLHTSWNFFMGGIFGFPVSGTVNRSSLIHIHETGPDYITGGPFGPEAGLSGLAGILLILLFVYLYMRITSRPLKLHNSFRISSRDNSSG